MHLRFFSWLDSSFLLVLNNTALSGWTTVYPFNYCPISSPAFSVANALDFGHSKRCVQFSSVQSLSRVRLFATPWIAARQASCVAGSNSFTLHLSDDIRCGASFYVLICHLYIFFGDVSVQIIVPPFQIRLFILLLLSFKCSLYILNNSPLSKVFFENFFSYSVVVFSFSWHCFCRAEVLILMKSSLAILSSMVPTFGAVFEKSCWLFLGTPIIQKLDYLSGCPYHNYSLS